jgi:AmmeMemoRadiSam system protein A
MNTWSGTELGPLLLGHARHAIARHLGLDQPAPASAPELAVKGATFVSLYRDGQLRGCMGSIRPQRMLGEDVTVNAVAAASRDPRFAPLTADEFPQVRIEVSLLSEPRFVDFADEDDLLTKLKPGVEGVLLFSGCRHATFLPQVWEQLPEPPRFLAALKQKAGLAADRPAPNLMVATYSVQRWKE